MIIYMVWLGETIDISTPVNSQMSLLVLTVVVLCMNDTLHAGYVMGAHLVWNLGPSSSS